MSDLQSHIDSLDIGKLRARVAAMFEGRLLALALINSVAEGFANSTSDWDLMAIVGGDSTVGVEKWVPIFEAGRRFDVQLLPESLLRTRLWSEGGVDVETNQFMHKLRRARVLDGEAFWNDLVHKVDWDSFDRHLCFHYFVAGGPILEDIAGNLSEDDAASATLNARRLVGTSLDAYLSKLGESQPRPKWRLKKAARALGADSPLIARYLALECAAAPPDANAPPDWLERALRFVRHLQLLTITPGDVPALPDEGLGGTWLVHPPMAVLSPMDQAFLVFSPSPSIKLPSVQASAWLLAPYARDAVHLAELLDAALKGDPSPAMTSMAIEELVVKLIDKRLLCLVAPRQARETAVE